jgi:hypothetical protein
MKSSGEIREFASGAVRDSATGKARMELLPYEFLMRVADWYGAGADKYGDNNWRKGQPQSAVVGSLSRHLAKYVMGMRDEDHLAAIVWNAFSLMNAEEYYGDNRDVCDMLDWFEDGRPTGRGSQENEKKMGDK